MLPKFSETSVNYKHLNVSNTLSDHSDMQKHNYNILSTLVLLDYSNLAYLDLRQAFYVGDPSSPSHRNSEISQAAITNYPTLNF